MLGQTYRIGPNLNSIKWDLGNMLGNGFENHIFNVLSKNMEEYFKHGATIEHTSASRDHGKDIIIQASFSLENILGINFYIRDKEKLKIYIECKSSNKDKITYNSFAGNLSRIKGENVGYYVLITNTTIVPFSYYQFKEDAAKEGIEFILIDQYLLMKYLAQNNAIIGTCSLPGRFEDIYIEYQTNSCVINSKKAYEIYFFIRNYSEFSQSFSMQLSTDRNWSVSLEHIERIIDPMSSDCLRLIASKEHFDGLDELIINVQGNTFEKAIKINGLNLTYNFKPDLVGQKNKEIIKNIKKFIVEKTSNQITFLLGEAGAGKTRIVDEVLSELSGTNVNFCQVVIEKGINPFIKLEKELLRTGCLTNSKRCTSFEDVLSYVDTKYRKCSIIFDDFHNADITFLNDVRTLLTQVCPSGLTILFVCRDDFSVGNMDFFAFLEFCKRNYYQNIIELKPLSDLEAVQLIKSIVRGIPQTALEKIHSLSNNLPLFIIQVIEYLLDLKLVYLLNRNTVGIENIESFSAHLYIPKDMEEIYDKRTMCLRDQTSGETMIKFLYIASQVGISFSNDFTNIFFENNEELLKLLIQRRYIIDSAQGYTFVHESFFLYICQKLKNNKNMKKEVGIWLSNLPCVFNQLELLKRGQLYLWAEKKKEAQQCFSIAISEINNIENYSSININENYYKYIDEIYSLCITYKQKKQTATCKIYIALHYHTPYEAVAACDWVQKKLKNDKDFKKDSEFRFYLKEQTAHSYLNAGHLKKSEIILSELLSETILKMDRCDSKAVFDMYDKLANIYIKYNSFDIAKNYCNLSMQLAQDLCDQNLQALSYITSAKLYFYTNNQLYKDNIFKADKLLSKNKAYRIKCHNDVSILILKLMEGEQQNCSFWENLLSEANMLLDICITNNFANSVIRLHMLIAILYYLLESKSVHFFSTSKCIQNGINYSIKFGISTYIWQFYNLSAIISVRERQPLSQQQGLFDTVFNILKRQNLTYLGNIDIIYGNMLALTNIMLFYCRNKQESFFYKKLSQVLFAGSIESCDFDCKKSICQYECHGYLEIYQKEWKRLSKVNKTPTTIFGKKIKNYPLRDSTGFYLIIS